MGEQFGSPVKQVGLAGIRFGRALELLGRL